MESGIDDGWMSRIGRQVVSGILSHLDKKPRHIGIVMDGNRRYARLHGYTRKDGHSTGFKTMGRILSVAYAAGIKEITVYAFSIENFNRSPEEVEDLMDIARTRLNELVAHQGIAEQYGVRINILGRLELLPKDVQELANGIMESTKKYSQATLNLAMPYTARDDMATGIAEAANNAARNQPNEDISERNITESMHTAESLPLDLLIRTSNTFRLSDFLLWELNESTYLDFTSVLWPDFTPFTFLSSVLRWRVSQR